MTAQASLPLRIYQGAPDTVRSASTNLVAVTAPGATAKINGKNVHVYQTGSFGCKVDLQPGTNNITITATKDGETATIQRTIFRAEPQTVQSKASPAHNMDATVMFAKPVTVETLDGAYLQYGNGDDRLGGSKMGFLDAGIPLLAVGSKGSLYCVELAKDRVAYIPMSLTVKSSTSTDVVNTGSWSVSNTGKTDRVSISLPRKLPYHYLTELNPSTIMVDIFGATDNSNWITQRSLDLGIIEYVDFRQMSSDVYRVILRLKEKYQWGFQVSYQGDNLVIDVRHKPASLKLKDLVIGLDAGHGGEYPGARSPSGLLEKDVNLDIVMRVNEILKRKGCKTVLTRDSDTGPSMARRKQIWAEGNVDIAISVHNNSGGSPFVPMGTAVLYKHLFDRPLSICVTRRLLETGLPLFGIVENFNFSLNGPTLYPNCLIEGMFMSSLEDEEKLASPQFRQLFAEKIVAALEDYLREVSATK